MVDAGHFKTEDPVCDLLAEKLRSRFPELEVLRSAVHADCVRFL